MTLRRFLLLFAALLAGPGCAGHAPPAAPPALAAPAASGPGWFVERAAEAGLDCRLGHEGRSPLTILDTAGGGAALLDADADGLLDILIVGERRLWLYRNTDGQRFTDVSDQTGLAALKPDGAKPGLSPVWMGCAVGDVDNDGFPDIYITGYACSLMLHNRGGKTFADISAASGVRNREFWETSAAFFDADGDGREDLYAARYVRFGPQDRQTCNFRGVEAACPPHYYDTERGVFYRNLGGKRFADRTRAAGLEGAHGKGLGVAVADADGDGKPDLYVANDGVPADHFRNLGGGKFRAIGLEAGTAYTAEGRSHAGMGADWGDADNDLKPDLTVTAFQHEGSALYRNRGGNVFVEAGEAAGLRAPTLKRLGFGVRFGDFDNDGLLDLLMANGHVQDTVHRFDETAAYAQPPQLFQNAGQGNFREVSDDAGPAFRRAAVGRALCVGDLDNDGKQDALLVDAEGAPLLLYNREASKNQWLGLRLIGSRSPRNGAGAVVTVQTAEGSQRREAGTSGSYLAAHDPRIHFGLGGNREAQAVTIRWPSGVVDKLTQVAAGRWLTIREGQGAQ